MNRSVEKKRLREMERERDAYRAVAIYYAKHYHDSNPDVGMEPSWDDIAEEVDASVGVELQERDIFKEKKRGKD